MWNNNAVFSIPVSTWNIFDVASMEPVASLHRVGENFATTTSASWPHMVARQWPVCEHQTFAVLSKDAVTILSLKGKNDVSMLRWTYANSGLVGMDSLSMDELGQRYLGNMSQKIQPLAEFERESENWPLFETILEVSRRTLLFSHVQIRVSSIQLNGFLNVYYCRFNVETIKKICLRLRMSIS